MKITVDGSAEIGWTVEIFERLNDPVAMWSGHPDVASEADAVRAALAEWEHPTRSPEDRAADEQLVLNQKALAHAVRVAEAQVAAEDAARAEAERRHAEDLALADAKAAEARALIAAEDAAARERNAAEAA